MTTALAERPPDVQKDQLDLIRRTVAKDATPDELALFLYDCQRRGIHPLDKLLHFTKRKGKYTPITSIDFMRTQAGVTGEMAGSDDPNFVEADTHPLAASVTVYRMTQGQRYGYSATARWAEYYPGDGDPGFMWRKMPHTMLGKCAEALALRKAFPQQLAGLYAREEMDQADTVASYVEAPQASAKAPAPPLIAAVVPAIEPTYHPIQPAAEGLLIERMTKKATKNPNITQYKLHLSDGRTLSTIREQIAQLAEQLCQERTPVTVKVAETRFGLDCLDLKRAATAEDEPPLDFNEPVDLDRVPF